MTALVPLDPTFVEALRRAWAERVGHSTDGRASDSFVSAVREAVQDGDVPADSRAIEAVMRGAVENPVLQALVRRLFNNETYFFRDSVSTSSLFTELLPDLLWERRRTRRLSIWSAGCSSGEELYTISILLSRLVPDLEEWNLTLVGSDLSMAALSRARASLYGQSSLRNTSEDERRSLFVERGTSFELRERYRKNVQFVLDNVTDPIPTPSVKFDLILSRNVGIYLSESGIARWSKKILSARAPGGVLVTAPADPLPRGAGQTSQIPGLTLHRAASQGAPARSMSPATGLAIPVVNANGKSSEPFPPASARPPSSAATPRPVERPARKRPRPLTLGERMERARGLGNEGRIDEALTLLDGGGAVFLTNASVQALRGTLLEAQGRTDHAAEAFRRAVMLQPTPHVCLSFGIALEKLGLLADAADAFRKASSAMGGENEALHRSTALARLNQLERRKQR